MTPDTFDFNLIPANRSDGLVYVYGWQSIYDLAVRIANHKKRTWTAQELWGLFLLNNKRQTIQ
jgi:hypothetical protein